MSTRSRRVAVIYHFFPHYRAPVVEALARSSVAHFTFVGDDHEYLHSIEPAKLSERVDFRLAPTHLLLKPFMWQWGAITQAVRPEFDTVILHSVPHWPCTWIGGLLARMLGKRVLFWGHGYLYRPRGLKGLVRRIFYAIAHEHLFYGMLSKAYAIELGWKPEKLHVVFNSLDVDLQVRIRERRGRSGLAKTRKELFGESATPVVICTTRLTAMRRIDLLLHAVARLNRSGTPVNVILLGDGPERVALERLAAELNVKVHFEGACYDEERIAELVLASNVTVSPGKIGLTAMHSMIYGVPVVTHDDIDDQAPEFEAIIPGKTGSLFHAGDVNSLAEVIRHWVQVPEPAPEVRIACQGIIERLWNPDYQRRVIERAVTCGPADDLLSCRDGAPRVR